MSAPAADRAWLLRAIELSTHCPPSAEAYSVGAVVVAADGRELASGYSRDTHPTVHAEESALARLAPGTPQLWRATLYTSLEPCSRRRSRARSCTDLVLAAGLGRVVLAWREPDLFVADCRGSELLAAGGVAVVEVPECAPAALAANRHLPLTD